jgi:hypothetical protein
MTKLDLFYYRRLTFLNREVVIHTDMPPDLTASIFAMELGLFPLGTNAKLCIAPSWMCYVMEGKIYQCSNSLLMVPP